VATNSAAVELAPLDLLYRIIEPPPTPSGERYFALVLKVDPSVRVGNILAASTHVGNFVKELVPPGVKVVRSIEITKDTAYNGIR
jgi:hypothetical protein